MSSAVVKMRAAFDGKVSFGDILLVANNVVIGIDLPDPRINQPKKPKIAAKSARRFKTSKERAKIIAFLDGNGPATAADIVTHVLGSSDRGHPRWHVLVQTIGRMLKAKILSIPAAERGKSRPKYVHSKPLGRPRLVA